MFISPSFITYIAGLTPVYLDLFLVALDSSNTQIGAVSVPVLRATGNITDIENFTPLFLGLKSDTSISAVTVDWKLPLYPSGATLFFDDLTIFPLQVIPATIDIDPDTVNLKSKGKFITCYIKLPEGYSVEDIDIDSVTLTKINDDLLAPPLYTVGPSEIGD
jgi:hypothetical protein